MSEFCHNHIIAQLSTSLRREVQTHSRIMVLSADQEVTLYGSNATYVYFPETALLSLALLLPDSSCTEILTAGSEGLLTTPEPKDGATNLIALVLLGGNALRIPQLALRSLAESHSQLQRLLTLHSNLTTQQLCQVIACYRHHSITQQLSRLLLAHDDRFPAQSIRTTHARLARRLGVRREAISTAAGHLQKAGALYYHRGQIDRIDRDILLQHSCNCYQTIKSIEQKKTQQILLGSTLRN